MLKDLISWIFVGGCSGAACRTAGAPVAVLIALAVVLALGVGFAFLYRRLSSTPALARGRAHDHLIPAVPRTYRARRA